MMIINITTQMQIMMIRNIRYITCPLSRHNGQLGEMHGMVNTLNGRSAWKIFLNDFDEHFQCYMGIFDGHCVCEMGILLMIWITILNF